MGLPVDLVAASPPTLGYLPCPEQLGLNIVLLAGYVAREMGLPVDLVAAVTPNDIVNRTLQTGDFSLRFH